MTSFYLLLNIFILSIENYSDSPEKKKKEFYLGKGEGKTFVLQERTNELKPTFLVALMYVEKVPLCLQPKNF